MEKPVKTFDSKVMAGLFANLKNQKARKFFYVVRKVRDYNQYGVFKIRSRLR